ASTGAGPVRRSLALAGGRTLTNARIDGVLRGRAGPLLLWRNVGRRPRRAHLRAARDAYLATPPDVRVVFYRAMRNLALTDRLGSVAVPTTVVVGTRDRLTRPRLSRLIASGIPGARLVEAPGAGHLLPYEEPDLLADLISNAREDQ
ncbi:MAG: alpha/beta fold hydrolase, partial [Acidimicrobiia bacterium]